MAATHGPDVVAVERGTVIPPAAAIRALETGRLIIYPTETLYALGGRALEPLVCAAVRAAKRRDDAKPLPLVVASLEQASTLWASVPVAARRLAERYWPGPLTLVGRARRGLPDELTAGGRTLALRVSGEAIARGLCRAAGALVSTSANLSGAPPPQTCEAALASVGKAVALALDAGLGRPEPSTVVDVSEGPPRLVRAGAIEWSAVLRALED